MVEQWNTMRTEGRGKNGEQHMFHAEFGHFSNLESFKTFEKYAV